MRSVHGAVVGDHRHEASRGFVQVPDVRRRPVQARDFRDPLDQLDHVHANQRDLVIGPGIRVDEPVAGVDRPAADERDVEVHGPHHDAVVVLERLDEPLPLRDIAAAELVELLVDALPATGVLPGLQVDEDPHLLGAIIHLSREAPEAAVG